MHQELEDSWYMCVCACKSFFITIMHGFLISMYKDPHKTSTESPASSPCSLNFDPVIYPILVLCNMQSSNMTDEDNKEVISEVDRW